MSYGPYMQQHTYHIKDKMKKTVIFFKSEFLPSPASTDALQKKLKKARDFGILGEGNAAPKNVRFSENKCCN